jgi:4-hydroxy-3-polyprenylbenzoate decarboxylase
MARGHRRVRGLRPGLGARIAVGLWIGGFDLIYACQDAEIDRSIGVRSVPARYGVTFALRLSIAVHVVTFALFVLFGALVGLGWLWWIGLGLAAAAFVYEHAIVRPADLSRVNRAFFTANGFVGIALFAFALADLVVRLGLRPVATATVGACVRRGWSASPAPPGRHTPPRSCGACWRRAARSILVVSRAARLTILDETGIGFRDAHWRDDLATWLDADLVSADLVYWPAGDLAAGPSSGSYPARGMVVVPASTAACAGIAIGLSKDLLQRAAEVTLKEHRRLVVVPRETPVTRSHLQHLLTLHDAGATVLPASPAFYSAGARATADELVDFVAGKVLDALGVPHTLFTRWKGR